MNLGDELREISKKTDNEIFFKIEAAAREMAKKGERDIIYNDEISDSLRNRLIDEGLKVISLGSDIKIYPFLGKQSGKGNPPYIIEW